MPKKMSLSKKKKKKKKKKQPKKRPAKATKPVAKKAAKKAAAKKRARTKAPTRGRVGGVRPAQPAPALSEEDREVLLALQDELGIPPGVRPAQQAECQRVLAYHEAGHAVVGHVLGRTLRAVSATQHCDFEQLPGEWTQLDIENSAKIALAGPHAEVRASKEKVSVAAGADIPQAKDHAEELAGSEWKKRLEELSIASQTLVLENWKKIDLLAQRLVSTAKAVREKDLKALLGE